MASSTSSTAVDLTVGEDLNGDVYEALTVNTSGQVVKTTAASDVIVGFVAEDPGTTTTAGEDTVPVALIGAGGILKAKAGATITAGQLIIPDSTAGRVAGVAAIGNLGVDSMAVGIALEGAADGEIFEFLAMPVAGPHSA